MPSGAFLTVLDDVVAAAKIASTSADDIASMTVASTQRAGGVVVDDMAVTAGGLVGVDPKRELPIVKAVAMGSLRNKFLYLIPGALALSAAAPWAITPLLMAGGAFLSYEGAHKIRHAGHGEDKPHLVPAGADPVKLEKQKIDDAIKTDVILSGEIVALTLAGVATAPLLTKMAVLGGVGAAMTVGVYGTVAALVKLDDMGLALARKENPVLQKLGRGILKGAPGLFKGIAAIGTAAMLTVGGGILLHGVPGAGEMMHHLSESAGALMPLGGGLVDLAGGAATGLAAGLVATSKPVQQAYDWAAPRLQAVLRPVQALVSRLRGASPEEPALSPEVSAPAPVAAAPAPEVSPTRALRSLSPPAAVPPPANQSQAPQPSKASLGGQ